MEELSRFTKELTSSGPYETFRAEQLVRAAFQDAGWDATHGFYYKDGETGKFREIDVLASRHWSKKSKPHLKLARVSLVVEVKSMKGFTVLLSERQTDPSDFYNHWDWFGDSSGKYPALCKGLETFGGTPQEIQSIQKRLNAFAYPGGLARMRAMMPNPPEIPCFSAFKETNTKSEKELDNSVVWRASQSLRSASSAIFDSVGQVKLENALLPAEYEKSRKEWAKAVLSWAADSINIVDIVHPVIVTDASLWVASPTGPLNVPYARFGLHLFNGEIDWWCDLVNSQNLAAYISLVTNHYSRVMRSARAKQSLPPNNSFKPKPLRGSA